MGEVKGVGHVLFAGAGVLPKLEVDGAIEEVPVVSFIGMDEFTWGKGM